jgi:polysaccharide biosynthesis protein PslG
LSGYATIARMSRRTGWFIVIAAILVGVLILTRGFATPDRSIAPTLLPTSQIPTVTSQPKLPTPTATFPTSRIASPAPTPTPVSKPDIGVQGQFVGPAGDSGIKSAANLGAGWIKQQIDWNSIEYARGLYRWGELDQLVAEAQKYGLKIMFSVARAPGFSRPEPVEEDGPPSDFSIFRDFMHALSSRYQGRVAAYELWNEPNLKREWRGFALSADQFVELVKAGSAGVREGDPDAIIISGAPAVTGIDDGVEAIDDRRFFREMIAAGVDDLVDAIGVHPYGAANPPDERASDAAHLRSSYNNHPSFFFLDTIEDYHQILSDANINKPLWVTEFGWPSIEKFGGVDTTGWEYARAVTEADQATYLLRAIALRRDRSWLGPLIVWNLNIAPLLGADRSESAYGLLRPDGSERPAYRQLRASGE